MGKEATNYNKHQLISSGLIETMPRGWMDHGNTWVVPFVPGLEKSYLPEILIPVLYTRMKYDETLSKCFQGPAAENLVAFANFFHRPDVSLLVAYDLNPLTGTPLVVNRDDFPAALMGGFWLSSLAPAHGGTRGTLGFVFTEEYWQPRRTTIAGRAALNLFFNALGINLITIWCLSENRLARRYLTRLGFRRITEVPDYGVWEGKPCSGLLYTFHKKDFAGLHLSPEHAEPWWAADLGRIN